MPAPVITAYQKYTAFAEKFMALVTLGIDNSRMKDFYDLCVMFRTMQFDADILLTSIRAAFKARNNQLPKELPSILTGESCVNHDKNLQWNAFVNRSAITFPMEGWANVVAELRLNLLPILEKLGASVNTTI